MERICVNQYDAFAPFAVSAHQLEAAGEMFNALRDPAHLRLLVPLSQGERCVTELVKADDAKLSSVSARLKVLHAAQPVSRRRDAKHVFYALSDHYVLTLLDSVFAHANEPSPVPDKNAS